MFACTHRMWQLISIHYDSLMLTKERVTNKCTCRCKLTISLLIQLHHLLTTMFIWRVKSIQMTCVCTQLFHSPSPKCVTCCDKYTQVVFNEPETDLEKKTILMPTKPWSQAQPYYRVPQGNYWYLHFLQEPTFCGIYRQFIMRIDSSDTADLRKIKENIAVWWLNHEKP